MHACIYVLRYLPPIHLLTLLYTTPILAGVLWAVVFVSVARAFFNSRLAPYKTAALASLLYACTNYSSMVYLMTTYYDLNLDKDEVCYDYFKQRECLQWIVWGVVWSLL